MVRSSSLIVALSLLAAVDARAAQEATPPPRAPMSLDVPYVPQTEALCGGAAVAMVFRYWGDTHAGAEQFAPLVDRAAAGIADDLLVDAIRERGWRATVIAGSLEALRQQLAQQRPVIILLEERPRRYHYLVITGADEEAVVLHDPSWGPSRRLPIDDLIRAWRPANFWALVVTPVEPRPASSASMSQPPRLVAPSRCDALLDSAINRVKAQGLEQADAAFGDVQAACPNAAGPLRELAGVRFAQRRWHEAVKLADRAVARDPGDAYAWDVLASSRFLQNDLPGALDAWNRIGKPRVDAVDIAGLQHARYAVIADALGLAPHALLTQEAFERAARRLNELPDRSSARLSYDPGLFGFAKVEVAIAERASRPHGSIEWSAAAARSLVDREIEVTTPGFTGQGERWSASWRWWSERPRVAVSFGTPHVGTLPGVWNVDGSWESQRYVGRPDDAPLTETRAHGGVTMSDWLTGRIRYSVGAGFDEWNQARRTASVSAGVERRLFSDRLSTSIDAAAFAPMTAGLSFQSVSARLDARTSTAMAGRVFAATAGVAAVSAQAPLALWPGAGDGHARPVLLRAHPLLDGGVIDGPAFGRVLVHANGEVVRWLDRTSPLRIGIAAFTDTAQAAGRLPGAVGSAWNADAGLGVRLKTPGMGGTLRADFARGLVDGATAFTIGWQY